MADINAGKDIEVSIPFAQTIDGVTQYQIRIVLGDVHWTVERRYSSFAELHQQLVNNHGIAKDILPPKKLIGNKDPAFIEKRRMDLQGYVQVG